MRTGSRHFLALVSLLACAATCFPPPARAQLPSCGWVDGIQDWSGSLSWSWGHDAQWTLIPDTDVHATVQDGGSCSFELDGFVGTFTGDVDGTLAFDDYLEQKTDDRTSFQRTVLSGPIVGPFIGGKAQMLLFIDSLDCIYTWQMVPYGEGTYSTESFSESTDGYPSSILPGEHAIPEQPAPLVFSGAVPATNNPQVGAVDPQYAFNASAAFASVGRASFQPATVSWIFRPGQASVPYNDTCEGATFLFPSEQQDTSFATVDPAEPTPSCGAGDRSVWFFFFAPATGTAHISTVGSGYSTIVSVSPMTPSCAALAGEIACGTDGATVPVQANTAYRVQIRRSGGGGTGALQVTASVPEPSAGGVAAVLALAVLAARRPAGPDRSPPRARNHR